MADLMTLTCPSCGGQLQVTNETDRFVCAHCGNSHLVDPGQRVESLAGELEQMRLKMDIRQAEDSLMALQGRKAELEKVTAGQKDMRRMWLAMNVILPIGVVVTGVRDGANTLFTLLLAAFLGGLLLLINLYLSMSGRQQPEQSELKRLNEEIVSGSHMLDILRRELQRICV